MRLDKEKILALIADGYLMVNRHPTLPLSIYNYTRKAQFERMWNEFTLLCRGLVLDDDYNTVAIPFEKFFNYEELIGIGSSYHNQFYGMDSLLPFSKYEVYDKMDGSLGILFNYQGQWLMATRGSFASDQSIRASEMIKKYDLSLLDVDNTYLFEIIYPENRIVVNYEGAERLVLLGVINNLTGYDLTYDQFSEQIKLSGIGFEIVKRYDAIDDIATLKSQNLSNQEGYVLRFGKFRMKVKFEEYCRLHSIITNISTKNIWKCLKDGQDINELLENTPDEFDEWVKDQVTLLKTRFKDIEEREKARVELVKASMTDPTSKKEFAESILKWKAGNSSISFKMFEGRSYDHIIWRVIEPEWSKPFVQDDEA